VSDNNGLSYFYSDHLGSASALQKPDASMAYTWYLPFGGYRPGSAPTQTITDRDFTGQRENMELGLLYYNARFYAPTLGRFISADTIIPDLTNPQQFNRFTYSLNNPTRYSDPSGHCIFGIDTAVCIAAAISAGVGLIVDYGSQVVDNMQAGMPFWDAVYKDNINWRQTAVSTVSSGVGGAVAGPIAGKAGSSLISKLMWHGLGGAVGGLVGGQTGALAEASWDEAANLLSGSGIDGQRFLNNAQDAGLLDGTEMAIDTTSGAVLAWAGAGFNAALSRAVPSPWQPTVPRRTVIKFTPTLEGTRMYFELEGKWVEVPPDRVAQLIQALSQGLVDVASDIIIETVDANADISSP
jgi:RHS repeat-associated protein